MKKHALLAAVLVLGAGASAASAATGTASGPDAVALAGVVAAHSPVLSTFDRHAMARLFDGRDVNFPPHRKIHVKAGSIVCRESNVDVISRSCELHFGSARRVLEGREANEMFATLQTAGVGEDAGAGSVYESVTRLACRIDPNEIRQNDGSGAKCVFRTQ